MGSESYASEANFNNKPTAFLVVYQQPDANAMDVAKGVKETIAKLAKRMPKAVEYTIAFDTTKFISASIDEVISTLFQTVALVILVVFVFSQNWRATLIPAIAIPVSLIGTFAVLKVLGFSINTLTLFGLVLAIGVVIDDVIVVIENVERLITKEGMSPVEATSKAMKEVSGPIVATTLVLLAVFVPVAFMPGITGELYLQFVVTISVAVLISSINALTLSPALCATSLKQNKMGHLHFLQPVDRMIGKLTGGYKGLVSSLIRKASIVVVLFVVMIGATGYLAGITPSGFVPDEDQGFFIIDVQLPDASSLNRTMEVVKKVTDKINQELSVDSVITVAEFSILSGNNSMVLWPLLFSNPGKIALILANVSRLFCNVFKECSGPCLKLR